MPEQSFIRRAIKDIKRSPSLYGMIIPVLLFYILFCYKPMYGALIAFMDYIPGNKLLENEWIGMKNFIDFFNDRSFVRILKNTLIISITQIIFVFPAPIILALLINELRSRKFSRIVQTVSYMPHFISLVVICGIIKDFTNDTGVITQIMSHFGFDPIPLLSEPSYFVPIYTISNVWETVGYSSIIYLAALTSINQDLYEAAAIDGAGRWRQTRHITIPCLVPTIVTMLVLRLGNIMNVGFEKIILLYNSQTYETADVISTYVYRKGLLEADFSYSTAVGLFNSVINFVILIIANTITKKLTNTGLW